MKAEKASNKVKKDEKFKLDDETLKNFNKRQREAYDQIQASIR